MRGIFQGTCCTFTDQFEHPRAAAARGEAAEQSENNDGGSGPDEDIWCVGALLRGQGEIGLQAHLPPHADRQQDHTCELKTTAGRVGSGIKEPKREMSRFSGPPQTQKIKRLKTTRSTTLRCC